MIEMDHICMKSKHKIIHRKETCQNASIIVQLVLLTTNMVGTYETILQENGRLYWFQHHTNGIMSLVLCAATPSLGARRLSHSMMPSPMLFTKQSLSSHLREIFHIAFILVFTDNFGHF